MQEDGKKLDGGDGGHTVPPLLIKAPKILSPFLSVAPRTSAAIRRTLVESPGRLGVIFSCSSVVYKLYFLQKTNHLISFVSFCQLAFNSLIKSLNL